MLATLNPSSAALAQGRAILATLTDDQLDAAYDKALASKMLNPRDPFWRIVGLQILSIQAERKAKSPRSLVCDFTDVCSSANIDLGGL